MAKNRIYQYFRLLKNEGEELYMRKLVLLLMGVFVLMTMTACGKEQVEGESLGQQIESSEKKGDNAKDEKNDSEICYEELFGYKFAFIESVSHESRGYGHIEIAEQYKVVLFKKNVISFSTWDNTIADCEELFGNTLRSCLSYSGCNQTVSSIEQKTNEFGEEILWVEGVLEREEGNLDYYAVYYVTGEGKVRFAIGIPNGEDSSRAKEAMECLADNLQKAE